MLSSYLHRRPHTHDTRKHVFIRNLFTFMCLPSCVHNRMFHLHPCSQGVATKGKEFSAFPLSVSVYYASYRIEAYVCHYVALNSARSGLARLRAANLAFAATSISVSSCHLSVNLPNELFTEAAAVIETSATSPRGLAPRLETKSCCPESPDPSLQVNPHFSFLFFFFI